MDCRILFIGDVMGRPGRRAITEALPTVRKEFDIDCVIANCENASGGKGVKPDAIEQMLSAGVDVFTSGNHIWDKADVIQCFKNGAPLLRPANYPHTHQYPMLGKDYWLWSHPHKKYQIAIINLMGRVFMDAIDCPFQCIQKHLGEMRNLTPIIFVDMHCEATSEKAAMAWFLDGKVSAVIGSHTHVPTADGRLLPQGTAFQTDAGMTGPYDSIIGMKVEPVLEKFLSKRPQAFDVAKDNIWLSSVCITVDAKSGRATKIEPVRRKI